MHVPLSSLLLLAAPLLSFAAPIEEVPVSELEVRQIGGGPGNSEVGTGWSYSWRDSSLLAPTNFDAVRGTGCSYDITFRRDVRDQKYNLSYQSVFGEGEIEHQEEKIPINLQYRGSTDGEGRREYYALVQNACSTFYDDRRAPRGFRIYFTPKPGQGNSGYRSPTFA